MEDEINPDVVIEKSGTLRAKPEVIFNPIAPPPLPGIPAIQCSTCRSFIGNQYRCLLVEGRIPPGAVCILWSRR